MLNLNDFIYDPNLVFYLPCWKKDGAVIKSDDARGYLCTVTGPKWIQTGYSFDGVNDYIVLTAPELNFVAGDFSLVYYLKLNSWTSGPFLTIRGNASGEGWRTIVDTVGAIGLVTQQSGVSQTTTSAAGIATLNKFITVGYSRMGSSVKIFCNGVDVSAVIGVHTNPVTSTNTVKIGTNNALSAQWLDGTIHTIMVFNKWLTPQEQLNIHLLLSKQGNITKA